MRKERYVQALAARQHGLITYEQRRKLGLSDAAIARRVALGRLHRILLEAADLDVGQITRYANAGTAYYQAALVLRPTWPWDWGNLALVKYQQYQDMSAVYQDALVRAVEFGPRESSLQDQVAQLGSHSWSALNSAAAEAVLTAANRALEGDAQWFPGMSGVRERWRPLCAHAGNSFAYFRRRCEMLGLT